MRPGPTDLTVFEQSDTSDLPTPAQRLLATSIPEGTPLLSTVELVMEGQFKLKDWLPFRATQTLVAGEGFTWAAIVGKRPITFSGGDSYWNGAGELKFKLWGIVPVASGDGPDISRSAAGRMVVESVAWVPQYLIPRPGVEWEECNDDTARVTLTVRDQRIPVDVTIDSSGYLREVSMLRWGDPDSEGFRNVPFGGEFDDWQDFGGITVPVSGHVGWWWNTDRQTEGEFFRFRITEAEYV